MSTKAGESASNTAPRGREGNDTPDVHTVALTVWDVPSATAAGGRFTMVVGARCSIGCDLGGRELSFFDQNGVCAMTAKLDAVVWPGTEALYFVKVEATAPLDAGSHPWEARMAGWDAEAPHGADQVKRPPHAASAYPLTVCVVSAPDCTVTVKVVDSEMQTPIAGARVVLHPYRAVTDDNGIASVKITKGQYDILVSASRYLPVCVSAEVSADMTATTALDADQPDEILE